MDIATLEKVAEVAWETHAKLICDGTNESIAIGEAFADFARRLDALVETEDAELAALGDPREGEF